MDECVPVAQCDDGERGGKKYVCKRVVIALRPRHSQAERAQIGDAGNAKKGPRSDRRVGVQRTCEHNGTDAARSSYESEGRSRKRAAGR